MDVNAVNDSIIAIARESSNTVEIRDAFNFDYIRSSVSTLTNATVSICGGKGNEIIVTTSINKICARRGNEVEVFDCSNDHPCGIRCIGCETHLIVATGGSIKVYEVNHNHEVVAMGRRQGYYSDIFSLRQSWKLKKELIRPDTSGRSSEYITWGPDKRHFVVCYPHLICIWKFDASNSNASLIETITVNGWEIKDVNLALTEDYIVVSSKDKKMYVWDRSNDKWKWKGRLFAPNERKLSGDNFMHPLHLSCHGHILVTSNHRRRDICVWNLKTGQLLKRHDDPEKVERPYDSDEVSDIVYLENLNALLYTRSGIKVIAFPTSQRQSDNAVSRRQRHSVHRGR